MPDSDVPSVTPAEAKNLVEQGWTLLDVRTDAEWADGHIPSSRHLSMDNVVQQVDTIGNQIVCVCASGGRSWRVTQYLALQGIDAVNLEGGVQAWEAQGLPVER